MYKITESDFVAVYTEVRKLAQNWTSWSQKGIFDIDDVVQNAMLKVLARSEQRKPTRAWLRLTLRSVLFDLLRKIAQERKYELRDDQDMTVSELIEIEASAYHCLPIENDLELLPRLNKVIDQLSPQQKQALLLCSEGYTYGQIASITKVGVGTVRSRLSYARRNAQKQLADLK